MAGTKGAAGDARPAPSLLRAVASLQLKSAPATPGAALHCVPETPAAEWLAGGHTIEELRHTCQVLLGSAEAL